MLQEAGDRFSLVGHSYGGAVALLAALKYRSRVRSLALYEPTLFALVDADTQHRMVLTQSAARSTQRRRPWRRAIPTALQGTSLTSGREVEAGQRPRQRESRRWRRRSSMCDGGGMPFSPSRRHCCASRSWISPSSTCWAP
ncbi:MAG: alpha/beta fold hydrolase [Gemmatimonadota bacterium]